MLFGMDSPFQHELVVEIGVWNLIDRLLDEIPLAESLEWEETAPVIVITDYDGHTRRFELDINVRELGTHE